MMKIQTYSVLAGTKACNGHCAFCVAKMTPGFNIPQEKTEVQWTPPNKFKEPGINWKNFEIGCKFAAKSGVSTVLITGKGEPTLYPHQIIDYLRHLKNYDFPFIELQTNGIALFQEYEAYASQLKQWRELGMTTVAISLVHYRRSKNKEIFQPNGEYMNLRELISNLHSIGFSVRLSITMIKDYIDNVYEVKNLVSFAKSNGVEQLTIRPVEQPKKSENPAVYDWVSKRKLSENQIYNIKSFLEKEAKELLRLVHNAAVYDLYGQNICFTNALTISASPEEVRQLIFFPDGHLRYDWQYPGAILL